MIKVNEYFDGQVKSLSFDTPEGPASAGVMSAGAYTFGTNCVEIMKVVEGVLSVQLPGQSDWADVKGGEEFKVEANVEFKVKCEGDVSYVCLYR